MSLHLSYILSQCVSVSLITSDYLWVFLCVLLFFYYLSLHSLSLCNSNSFFVSTIAPLQSVRCPNAFQLRQFFSLILILHHYLSLLLPLSLSLSLYYGHSLCLFFSTILISHYTSIILNSGKKLYWIFLFLMNLMKIIKWQKIILLLMAYEKLIHLIIIHKIITWHCQVTCPSYRNVPSFPLILILLLLCLPLSHSLCYLFL